MRKPFEELEAVAETIGSSRLQRRASDLAVWVTRPTTHVVVCGEFKRGKSTLVNALLETDVCPTDVLPETAVPAVFEHRPIPAASVEYLDGRREPLEPTAAAFRRFSAGRGEEVSGVRMLRVGLPSELLASGIVLVDTPGVNDLSQQRADVTNGFLPLADAAVLVLDATAPVTRTEAAFLAEHVLPNVMDRLVFVLGKADRVDPEELDDAVAGARARVEQITRRPAVVLPLSALRAVQGKREDLALLRERMLELARTNAIHRQQLAAKRARQLVAELRDELEHRDMALVVSDEEQARVREQAADARLKAAFEVDRFRDYIDLFGRHTLFRMISDSTLLLEKRVQEELFHQLSLLDGRIDDFVHKRVPHQIAHAVRGWSEAKTVELEVFLSKLIGRVSLDFARAFAVPLSVASLPPRVQMPEYASHREQIESSRVQEMITEQLLPTAVPMVAGLLMGGPIGLLVGGLVGRVAEAKLRENKVAEQKVQAEALLNELVPTAFADLRAALEVSLGGWFDRLKEAVATEARMRLEDLERTATRGAREQMESLSKARESLERINRDIPREDAHV